MSMERTERLPYRKPGRAIMMPLLVCIILLSFMASGPAVSAHSLQASTTNTAVVRPVIDQFTIDTKDVLTSAETILHTQLHEGTTAKWMYIREWHIVQLPNPHWDVAASSGWVEFQPDYPWKLSEQSGLHFVGVWVADENKVVSMLSLNSIDFASLQLPDSPVGLDEVVPYLVYYEAGVDVEAVVTPTSGDPDLYVWYPGNYEDADQTSAQPDLAVEQVAFTTPTAGIYVFMVHGIKASVYNMTLTPAGGPNAILWVTPLEVAHSASAPTRAGGLTQMPLFGDIGFDPLLSGTTDVPAVGWRFFLAMIRR